MSEDVLRAWYLNEETEELREIEKEYRIFPVAAYIHSGVVLSLGSGGHFPDRQWDVSHVGAVFVSKEGWDDESKAREAAEALIKTWNEYLSGDVYCIVHETLNEKKERMDYDIVCGYYGYEYAKEECKNEHSSMLEKEA